MYRILRLCNTFEVQHALSRNKQFHRSDKQSFRYNKNKNKNWELEEYKNTTSCLDIILIQNKYIWNCICFFNPIVNVIFVVVLNAFIGEWRRIKLDSDISQKWGEGWYMFYDWLFGYVQVIVSLLVDLNYDNIYFIEAL
jgi:hypothetical protein